jgi:hypothetical protein
LPLPDEVGMGRRSRPVATPTPSAPRVVSSVVARDMPSRAAQIAYDCSSAVCAMAPTRLVRSMASTVP